jgi:HSP20 family molecular chaperone IbpA
MNGKGQELERRETQVPAQVERAEPTTVYAPDVDICEATDAFTIVADMPGVDEKTVEIDVEQNTLTLRGRLALETPAECTLSHREYRSGSYERAFTLGNEVDRSGVKATMRDGVLRLHLPKVKEAQLRRIPVQVG